MPWDSSVGDYCHSLRRKLRREFPPDDPSVERILTEVEEHLHDAVERNSLEDPSPDEALRVAIRQFGAPAVVARKFGHELAPTLSLQGFLFRSYTYAVSFLGVALVAFGLLFLVLFSFDKFFGIDYAAGPPTYRTVYLPAQSPQAQCASLRSQSMWFGGAGPYVSFDFDACLKDRAPIASSSYVRARYDSGFGMTGAGRVDNAHLTGAVFFLIAGSFLWGSHAFLRRLHRGRRRDYSVPRRVYVAIALLLFGLATAWALPVGIVLALVSVASKPSEFAGVGPGYWLAAGLASAVFTARFLLSLRSLDMRVLPFRLTNGVPDN